ncbi:FtsX-like permease family protein [Verrucomicrobia bacterium]|nr:FtsX-like permease family protein [Verrucomicrobiota bacterium]
MTTWSLVLKSFRYYAKSHVGTIFGVAVGAMVLVGALLVGESVKGSLRSMAEARLGKVELTLSSNDRLFRAKLAEQIQTELGANTTSMLQLPGIAKRPSGQSRANNVVVLGVEKAFWELALKQPEFKDIPEDGIVLNERLASQLGNLKVGNVINLRVHNPSQLSRDAPMAPIEDSTASLAQMKIIAIVSEKEFGRFSLKASQVPPYNAFVRLDQLQEAIEKTEMANLMLIGNMEKLSDNPLNRAQAALAKHWQLADAQAELLQLPENKGIELRSPRVFLDGPLAQAARSIDGNITEVLTYFVNNIQIGGLSTPYSMVSALADFEPGTVWLNKWTADDLQAKIGDDVELNYYSVGTMRQLQERKEKFKIGGIISMDDPRSDITLMPDFPGMTDSENCADWDTGFPMNLDAIREKDEDYWDTYKGTPKAYISLKTGKEIWSNRFGDLTAIRFAKNGPKALELLGEKLLTELNPKDTGLTFEPTRSQAATSVNNALDFGYLFMNFSFFLIAAAVMLISLLFRFTMEKRTKETGTLLAVGISGKRVRGMLTLEGGLIAIAGCVIGSAAGTLFAKALLKALSTNWKDAVSSAALSYHSSSSAIFTGMSIGFCVAMFTIWWTLRKLNKQTACELLTGEIKEQINSKKSAKRSAIIGGILLMTAIIIVGFTLAKGDQMSPQAFYPAGALLLISGIAFAAAKLSHLSSQSILNQTNSLNIRELSQRNAARRSRRSIATIGMLACGSFMIASIGVFQKDASNDAEQPGSGTGGFKLMGEASIAVVHDMNNKINREDFYSLNEDLLEKVSFVPFRLRDGDQANCLNLNLAQEPRLLGVRPEMLAGKFTFIDMMDGLKPGDNPWSILESAQSSIDLPDDVIPVIADQSVMKYALSGGTMMNPKQIGDTLDYIDENGKPFKIKFVGQISDSILQGNLIISESDFIKRFPSESGYRVFLVDAPKEQAQKISNELNVAMADHGFEWVKTIQRLEELNAVHNTYLQTFQALGGLGLLVGSLGLGVVVMRNIHERKSELALLRAIGFKKKLIKKFVLHEYLSLLIAGLLIGAIAAVLAVLPIILSPTTNIPHALLASTLGGVFILAGLWTWIATNISLKGNLLDGLRHD